MFDKKLACTVAALLVVAAGSVWLVKRNEEQPAAPLQERMEGIEQEVPQELQSGLGYAYILREYEGRVAVFSAENDHEPEMILDTLVKYLPDYDRTQIQEGIRVSDYRELVALIEDFAS